MRILAIPFVAVLLALAGCSKTPAFSAADEKTIRTALDEWARALTAKEWGKVARLYTEDAVLMPTHSKTIVGRKAIEAYLSGFPPMEGFTITVDEVRGDGDLAYVRGTYAMRLRIPGAPEPVVEVGKFVEVRVRGDGSWPIARDIFNSDLPMR